MRTISHHILLTFITICVQNKKYRRLVSLQDTNLRYESSHGGDEGPMPYKLSNYLYL